MTCSLSRYFSFFLSFFLHKIMARGWESKSVEDQIAEMEARKQAASAPKLSVQEIAKRERMASLHLTRSRLQEQLSRARSAAHKTMLQRSLAD